MTLADKTQMLKLLGTITQKISMSKCHIFDDSVNEIQSASTVSNN